MRPIGYGKCTPIPSVLSLLLLQASFMLNQLLVNGEVTGDSVVNLGLVPVVCLQCQGFAAVAVGRASGILSPYASQHVAAF